MSKTEALILLGGALGLGLGIYLYSKNIFGLGQTSGSGGSYLLGAYDQGPYPPRTFSTRVPAVWLPMQR